MLSTQTTANALGQPRPKMDYNAYGRQLSHEEISIDQHREFAGSLWEELGRLQFEYLLSQGLKPEHRLLDLGCGALRGGLHFIRHLRTVNYTGVDANPSLLRAGKLERSGLTFKRPSLVHEAKFRAEAWGSGYDFIISISLLTHLPKKFVKRCLSAVSASLSPQGSFHASFFEAPSNNILGPLSHPPGNIHTYVENDPYLQSHLQMETYGADHFLSRRLKPPSWPTHACFQPMPFRRVILHVAFSHTPRL